MKTDYRRWFNRSVAVMLFVMAASEVFCAAAHVPALDDRDPLLTLPTSRQIIFLIAGVQLGISAYLLAGRRETLKPTLIAWLTINVVIYGVGLWSYGGPNWLVCLGNLDDRLAISPRVLGCIQLASQGYFLLGSVYMVVLDYMRQPVAAGASLDNAKDGLTVTQKPETA